ncbi:hypothetical protein BDV98DRAFT_644487 [Pterulicium gracile]|uniref:Uncharacterized protein n=1 Tax=Pterulicium gracile TaxID=1884261 RepID=A0A5C3Q522_9AGAR|nr:hypothetical protein BDV98DRAFT_644487 [Pterula gracilis]
MLQQEVRQIYSHCYLQLLTSVIGIQLSEEDLNALRAHSLRTKTLQGGRSFKAMCRSFPALRHLPTLAKLQTRITFLSGFKPVNHHCCINSCVCYADEQYKELDTCPNCSESRYDSNRRPRRLLQYMPFILRLLAWVTSPIMFEKLMYRANLTGSPEEGFDVNDYFDSLHYHELLDRFIEVDGETLGQRFFELATDIALALNMDGFNPLSLVQSQFGR